MHNKLNQYYKLLNFPENKFVWFDENSIASRWQNKNQSVKFLLKSIHNFARSAELPGTWVTVTFSIVSMGKQ